MVLARLSALDRRLPFGTGTLVSVTAACVFVSGWTAAYAKRADDVPGVAASPAPTAPAPSATAPAKPDSPDDYLLDVATVVPGYKRVTDRIAGAGPMDLEDAAEVEAGGKPTDEDREALRDLGFVRGHSRAWRSETGAVFVVLVWEWKDVDAPRLYVRGVQQVSGEKEADWASPLPHSTGVCTVDGGDTDDSILAAVGRYSFLMVLSHEGGCGDHAAVTDLATRMTKHAVALGA